METIRTYLENLFAGLPESERLTRAKADLLGIMEERYNDLKEEGKSENEAVGAVISQFGNIDELLEELEISRVQPVAEESAENSADNSIRLTDEQVTEFLDFRRSYGWKVGIGVMMCLFAPATLISLNALLNTFTTLNTDVIDAISVVGLFAFIAAAVCLFVIFGIKSEKYQNYEKQNVVLSEETKQRVEAEMDKHRTPLAVSIAAGLIMIFAGIIAVFASDAISNGLEWIQDIGAAVLMAMVGIGVLFMVKSGVRNDGYKYLLNVEKKDPAKMRPENNGSVAVRVFNAILWPLVVIIYLAWSFLLNDWGISWIVFPVAGLLSGIVTGVDKAVNENGNKQ